MQSPAKIVSDWPREYSIGEDLQCRHQPLGGWPRCASEESGIGCFVSDVAGDDVNEFRLVQLFGKTNANLRDLARGFLRELGQSP